MLQDDKHMLHCHTHGKRLCDHVESGPSEDLGRPGTGKVLGREDVGAVNRLGGGSQ